MLYIWNDLKYLFQTIGLATSVGLFQCDWGVPHISLTCMTAMEKEEKSYKHSHGSWHVAADHFLMPFWENWGCPMPTPEMCSEDSSSIQVGTQRNRHVQCMPWGAWGISPQVVPTVFQEIYLYSSWKLNWTYRTISTLRGFYLEPFWKSSVLNALIFHGLIRFQESILMTTKLSLK